MATSLALPKGFVLDQPAPAGLPGGFVLDKPSAAAAEPPPTVEQEKSRQLRELAESIGPLESFAISAGRGISTVARGLGIGKDESRLVKHGFEALQKEHPISTTIGEVAGEVLPFVPLAMATGGIAPLALRAGAVAAVGGLETSTVSRGKGKNVKGQLESGLVGATVAGGMELLLPVFGKLGGALVRRYLNKSPSKPLIGANGVPSAEFREALDASGLTFDDLTDEAQRILAQSPPRVDPAQAARSAVLEAEGLTPTRAQVTRDAVDFQAQQEAAKTSGLVRDALEGQEAMLTSRFDNAVLDTGGRAATATSTLTDALVDKATVLDKEISNLYKLAREVAPGEKNVKFDRLTKKLRDLAPVNRRTGGNIEAIVGDLQSKGVLDDNMKVVGKIDVETAEDVRKLMNELYDPQNLFGNNILRQLKDALDDDVFRAAGQDVFDQGRKAKHAFERELSRAKISKFDSRKASLVRDILENKISPDTFANDVVFSKKWRGSDLQQLKDYVTTTDAGKLAFDDLRAEVLDNIKNKAFIGPADASGFHALSRDKLETVIKKIGGPKMKVLFSQGERDFLSRMLNVAKLREPVRSTTLGRGPTAQAVSRLQSRFTNHPIMGALVEFITLDRQGRIVLKSSPAIKQLPSLRPGAIELGARGTIPALAAPTTADALTSERRD